MTACVSPPSLPPAAAEDLPATFLRYYWACSWTICLLSLSLQNSAAHLKTLFVPGGRYQTKCSLKTISFIRTAQAHIYRIETHYFFCFFCPNFWVTVPLLPNCSFRLPIRSRAQDCSSHRIQNQQSNESNSISRQIAPNQGDTALLLSHFSG